MNHYFLCDVFGLKGCGQDVGKFSGQNSASKLACTNKYCASVCEVGGERSLNAAFQCSQGDGVNVLCATAKSARRVAVVKVALSPGTGID